MKRSGFVVKYRHIFGFLICFISVTQICKILYATHYNDSFDNKNNVLSTNHNSISKQKEIDNEKVMKDSCVKYRNIEELIKFFENPDEYLVSVHSDLKNICQKASELIELLFQVELSNDSEKIIIPKAMETLVKEKWLKNDPVLFEKFLSPKTLALTNRWTLETTGINPLRALRPRQNSNADSLQYTLDLINRTKKGCNFCNKDSTSIDSFGRIENQKLQLYSAHNSFPYTDFVGIFIPEKIHNWMEVKFLICFSRIYKYKKSRTLRNSCL